MHIEPCIRRDHAIRVEANEIEFTIDCGKLGESQKAAADALALVGGQYRDRTDEKVLAIGGKRNIAKHTPGFRDDINFAGAYLRRQYGMSFRDITIMSTWRQSESFCFTLDHAAKIGPFGRANFHGAHSQVTIAGAAMTARHEGLDPRTRNRHAQHVDEASEQGLEDQNLYL